MTATIQIAGTVVSMPNQVTMVLPSLPLSKNKLYGPEPRTIHSDRVTWGPTSEAKRWRSQMQRYIKPLNIVAGSSVAWELHYFLNRYLKDGYTWRRVDVSNFIDWTIDTVCQKQDWDDYLLSRLLVTFSHDADRPRVAVRLTEIAVTMTGGEMTLRKEA